MEVTSIPTLAVLLYLLLVTAGTYAFLRNSRVYRYRMTLIDRIAEAQRRDLEAGVYNTGWRWKEYGAVSHDRMVYSFKPLASFYPRDPARPER